MCADLGRPAPHVERFTPEPVHEAQPGDAGFDVVLQRSGRTVHVPPELSILDAVERAGVRALSSCREGYCGTCEVGVVAGEVDHRDEYLTGSARESGTAIMICSSRARGATLVLDL